MTESALVEKEKTEIAVVDLGVTRSKLAALKKKYKLTPDATTPEGYEEICEMKRKVVPIRTGAKKEADIQKKAAQDHVKGVNKELAFITTSIEAIEKPWYAAKKSVDDAVALKAKAEAEAEENRIHTLEGKVSFIRNFLDGLIGADVETLEDILKELKKLGERITEKSFEEYYEPAMVAFDQATEKLNNSITERRKFEGQQAELKRQQDEMAENQKKMDAQQAVIDAQTKKDNPESEKLTTSSQVEKPERATSSAVSPAVQKQADEDRSVFDNAKKAAIDAIGKCLKHGVEEDNAVEVLNAIIANEIPSIKFNIF